MLRFGGHIDGADAIRQMAYFTLNSERYKHIIYSWNYGVEFEDLIGTPMIYAVAEIKRRIQGALLQDDRVLEVHSFNFTQTAKDILHVQFTISSVHGDIDAEKEVTF
jgi:hypothetical protein